MDDEQRGDWVDLGPVGDLPEGTAVLRKAEGQRFVCVRKGDAVHTLDDRCPHQGYPLSQGTVDDCTLTCEWHNWKFDLTTGGCQFGGEPVKRYLTLVENGRVKVDRSVDHAKEAARLEAGLRAALVDDDASRALREGLRLGQHRAGAAAYGALGPAFSVLVSDGAVRAEYGFDHGLAMTADTTAWVERGWLSAEEAFALAATCVAEPSRHLGPRTATPPLPVSEVTFDALLAFASTGLHDYGHGTIFLAKARELARRFPEARDELLASIAVTLGWATNETALPPFSATRKALSGLPGMAPAGEVTELTAEEQRAHTHALLAGEKEALDATLGALSRGVPARSLLRVAARAAAERTARFDEAWEERLDAEVGVLDVTHTLTYVEACLALTVEAADEGVARRMAVLAAGFIGKVRSGDRPEPEPVVATSGTVADLVAAASARDAPRARALARGLSADERLEVYRALAPFLAFEMAVRPIFVAHGVKMAEALYRLEQSDLANEGRYLDALLAFAVPRRPERRLRRIAHVATRFLADGRPPEGLY